MVEITHALENAACTLYVCDSLARSHYGLVAKRHVDSFRSYHSYVCMCLCISMLCNYMICIYLYAMLSYDTCVHMCCHNVHMYAMSHTYHEYICHVYVCYGLYVYMFIMHQWICCVLWHTKVQSFKCHVCVCVCWSYEDLKIYCHRIATKLIGWRGESAKVVRAT